MDDTWSFERLAELRLNQLKRIRDEKQNELADLRNERFKIAGQILFYQSEIAKEKLENER